MQLKNLKEISIMVNELSKKMNYMEFISITFDLIITNIQYNKYRVSHKWTIYFHRYKKCGYDHSIWSSFVLSVKFYLTFIPNELKYNEMKLYDIYHLYIYYYIGIVTYKNVLSKEITQIPNKYVIISSISTIKIWIFLNKD